MKPKRKDYFAVIEWCTGGQTLNLEYHLVREFDRSYTEERPICRKIWIHFIG